MTQKPNVTVRRAKADDAKLLAELGARTFQDTFSAENNAEDMADYIASAFNVPQQIAELDDSASTFLIAEVDEVVAGYAKLHAGDAEDGVEGAKPIELVRLYASREYLGHGIGATLMRACLGEARAAGYETIWLGVWERNMRAKSFYEKWDFRAVGEHVFQLARIRKGLS